jgi:hypothetical protein
MHATVAHGRPVGCLDKPAVDTTGLDCAPGLDQKEPRVLTDSLRTCIPWVVMLAEQAKPRPEHGQVGRAGACGAHAVHQAIPLVQRDYELAVALEHEAFVARPTRREREFSVKPQRRRAVQTAEPAAGSPLGAHAWAAPC